MFKKCQGFVEKVGEIRFNKVKNRQVNQFNNLLRMEGNITGVSTQLTTFSSSQAGRQAGSHLPRDSATSQAVSAVSPNSPHSQENLSHEGSSLVSSQAGRQSGTHLPREIATSQEASASSHNILSGQGPSWAGNNPPTQAGRQLGTQLDSGPHAPQGNSATPQASSASSQEGTPSPNRLPKGLPQKNLTLSGSLTYPANL